MYLAPLNYDRYFKKVFSDLKITKRFIEDFLDVEISTIEFLPSKNKITDDAQAVEFDFRCKIDNNYAIIEMQQWYKPDVVQRFYVYHALGAALQLEKMPKKLIPLPDNKTRKVHDYNELLPTITIIWMVHDTFDFTEDYICYTLTPEYLSEFIKDSSQWHKDNFLQLLERRKKLYNILQNDKKNLNFLSQNKLYYAFQKNIVNNKCFSKYFDWFELAEKTLKRISNKFEYDKYTKNEILSEVIRRLKKSLAESDSETYIENYEEYIEGVRRYDQGLLKKNNEKFETLLTEERNEKEQAKKNEIQAKKNEIQARKNEEQAKKNEQQAKIEKEQALSNSVFAFNKIGYKPQNIANTLKINLKTVNEILKKQDK